ncbi:Mitogen-activated protein kinase kinase kinase 3 [Diplonema papillatum]|nr:Mitogen-activated protein kinase kinase kinase 3 [Diplonema papillatum]
MSLNLTSSGNVPFGDEELVDVQADKVVTSSDGRTNVPEVRKTKPKPMFVLPIMCIIITLVLVSLAASAVGGIVLYLESIKALHRVVEEISLVEADDLANRLNQTFVTVANSVEGAKSYLYYHELPNRTFSAAELMLITRWLAFSIIKGSSVVQEIGVVLLRANRTDPNIFYTHVWYDLNQASERIYIHAYYRPEMQYDPDFYDIENGSHAQVDLIDSETGATITANGYERFSIMTYPGFTENFDNWPDSSFVAWNTTPAFYPQRSRWREPVVWFSNDSNPYVFIALDTVHNPPPAPHPFAEYPGIIISSYLIFDDWLPILLEFGSDDTVVWVVDRHHRHVYAATEGLTILPNCSAYGDQRTTITSAVILEACVAVADAKGEGSDLRLYDAFADKPTDPEVDTLFSTKKLDGTRYFVRYRNVFRSVTAGTPTIDVILIWARRTSTVENEVRRALILFLAFTGSVLAIDLVLGGTEVFVIGTPLKRCNKATRAMAKLDIRKAEANMERTDWQCRWVALKEVEELQQSLRRTLRFMGEYLAFMPQGVNNFPDSEDGRGEALDERSNAPPRSSTGNNDEDADNRKLEKIRNVALTKRTGTVMVCRNESKDPNPDLQYNKMLLFVSTVLSMVRKHGGIVLQLTPDACTATWNAHNTCSRHAYQAIICAVEIRKRSGNLFKCCTVISTGTLLAGNIGDHASKAVAASGEPLTVTATAARLPAYLGVGILISEETYDRTRASIVARAVDKLDICDGTENTKSMYMYEVKGLSKDTFTESPLEKEYNEAWRAFMDGDFNKAAEHWMKLKKDKQAERLTLLARHFESRSLDDALPYIRRSRRPWDDFEEQELNLAGADEFDNRTRLSGGGTDRTFDEADELEQVLNQRRETQLPGANCSNFDSGSFPNGDTQRLNSTHALFGEAHSDLPSRQESYAESLFSPMRSEYLTIEDELAGDSRLPPAIQRSGERKEIWYASGKLLGEGSYGKVFVGMTPDGELVALKALLLPRMDQSSQVLKDLINEVAVLSKLRHNHIVGYNGSALTRDHLVICMEYMPGGSLANLLADFNTLSLSTVKRYTKDMLKGLEFLHDKGIMHCDLKPGNVLVCSDGTCKLADFGSCLRLGTLRGEAEPDKSGVGAVVGTALYMAPEVVGGKQSCSSDIWSFGITFCELLAGEPPFDIDFTSFSPISFLFRLGTHQIEPTPCADMDPAAQEVVRSTLLVDPPTRATANQLLELPFYTQ